MLFRSLLLLVILTLVREPMVAGIQGILDQTLSYTDTYFAYHTPAAMLYCFAFGTTLYYAIRERKEFSYLLVMSGILIFGQFTWYRFEIMFTILVYLALKTPALVKNEKVGKCIGFASEGSFSFYLCHMMLFSVLEYITKRLPFTGTAEMIFCIVFIIVISYGIWWYLARPAEGWLKKRWTKA